MLHGERDVPVAFAVFDVLALDGEPTTNLPYSERRGLLESLKLAGGFGSRRQYSTTGRRCSRRFASKASRESSQSGAIRSIAAASAGG
jgi:ATP-dependent DNA ligase